MSKRMDSFRLQDRDVTKIEQDTDRSFDRGLYYDVLDVNALLRAAWAKGWEARQRFDARKRKKAADSWANNPENAR